MKKKLNGIDSHFADGIQKMWLIMRLTIFFTLVLLFRVSASVYSQQTKLNLKLSNVPLEQIFEAIQEQSDFDFFYKTDQIPHDKRVSVDYKNSKVETILEKVLQGTNLSFYVLDQDIVISPKKENTDSYSQQVVSISGKVTDTSGGALPGVTVIIKGTTNGTITDVDGNYSISDVPADGVLVFSFVGMKMQELPVGGRQVINVSLEEETIGLEEVVAIGYGTMKKSDLTGSVASVQSKDLASYPVANVAQALQGRVTGVTVTPLDGRPDASISFRIRGGGSITQSNDPLFIVDGFPVSSINDIPASQIESIDILKDASSTAIYGARGANGVVIITTKSAGGKKISVTYDGNVQIKTPANSLDFLDPYDFVRLNWEYGALFGYGDAWAMAYGLGTDYSNLNSGGINSYKNIEGRDIQKEMLGTTFSQSHNVTVSGNTGKTKYSVSFDYTDDDAIKIQSWYKRTSILAKLQQEIAKGLVLDLDMHLGDNTVFGNEDQSSYSGSKLAESMRFTPVTPLGDISGDNSQIGMYDTYIRSEYDPITITNDIYDKTHRQYVRANIGLSWEIINGLKLRSEYGTRKGYSNRYYYTGAIAKHTVGVEGGDATIEKDYRSSYRFVNTLNYDFKNLGDNHRLDVLVGQEINGNESENTELKGTRYPVAFDYKKVFAMMNQYGDQSEISISNTYDEPVRLSSYFGRVNYAFKDRYLFSATFRADGSSRFSSDNRWGYFPAGAIAWRISEEPFMQGLSSLDNLKLRLSYGEAGNDQITSGLWKPEWSAGADGYPYSNVGNSYYEPASDMMTNPNLKWETTITRNFGIDYGFFNNRVFGSIDGYWNTTKDLLMVVQLPAYTGYTSQMANVGQTRNLGLEFSVGGDLVRTDDFKLSANLNFSLNRNKVEELSDEMEYYYYGSGWASNSIQPSGGDYALIVGQPVGLIRGFIADGYYTTDDFNYDSSTQTYTLKDGIPNSRTVLGPVPGVGSGSYPGLLKLKKLGTENSATEINESDDATIIGNTNPKHTGGLTLNAMYKSFDLMLAFNWSYGNDVYNANKLANSIGRKTPFRNFIDAVEGWYTLFDIDENGDLVRVYDPADLDALNANATTYLPIQEDASINTDNIEDGSFLRLNNVTLGYTLPANISQKVFIQRLRVYATIYNAWLWTKYTGYDPEVDAGNGRNDTYPTPGMDFGAYPRARTFTFGVNVNF